MFKTLKQNLLRSPYQSLAAILVVSLSFFLITIFFLLGAGSSIALKFFQSRPQVIAYLKDEAKPQEIEMIKANIEATGKVKSVNYVSKEEALKIYKELFKDKPILLEMVTAKILPASLEISPINLSQMQEIVAELKKETLIEDIDYEEDIISNLTRVVNFLEKTGIVIAVFLLAVAVVDILTILGMRIAQKKQDIEILKLLGASGGYIRGPLYTEAIAYGIISALVSWIVSYLAILYVSPALKVFFAGIPIFPVPLVFMLELLGGLIILGVLVGFLGSFLAVTYFDKTVR